MANLIINGQKAKFLQLDSDGKIVPYLGCHISDVCREMVALAADQNTPITINVNGTPITATGKEDPDALLAAWSAELDRKAGVYRNPAEHKAREAAALAEGNKRNTSLDDLLATAPAKMTLANAEKWGTLLEANTDRSGATILAYAERWARCMEGRLSAGVSIADCAKTTSDMADVEGISGAMYGMAVRVLAECWVHGDELRRWHNLDIQIGKEGEQANESGTTLNPAVLCIG